MDNGFFLNSLNIQLDSSVKSITKVAAMCLSGSIENGIFTLDGKMQVLNFLMALEDFNFFKFYKTTHFITAFTRLYFKAEYEHDKMKSKLITHRTALEKRSTSDEYLVLLCNRIYSFGVTKNPIYYSSESKKFHQ